MPSQPTKQDYLDRLCALIGIDRLRVGVGSSLPRPLFDALAQLFSVWGRGGMPDVAERVATAAGIDWDEGCDSRATASGGGSTVTAEGLRRLLTAVESTYARDLGDLANSTGVRRGIGETYREADGSVTTTRVPASTDWSRTAEATREHAETQNALADYLRESGIEPLSPRLEDPQFDVGWAPGGGLAIAEIKSVRPENMVKQVRLGVGQLLHYAHQIAVRTDDQLPEMALMTSRAITPDLVAYCKRNGILLADVYALRMVEAPRLLGL